MYVNICMFLCVHQRHNFPSMSLSNITILKSLSQAYPSLFPGHLPLSIERYRSFTTLHCDLATFFFWGGGGGLCDYRQFLIWWRLRSFVMIIAEFWLVIGCKRSMALDSPSVVWAGQQPFSPLNEALALSIHPFHPYSLISLFVFLSRPPESVHQFGSLYIFLFSISGDILLCQVLKVQSCGVTPILDL